MAKGKARPSAGLGRLGLTIVLAITPTLGLPSSIGWGLFGLGIVLMIWTVIQLNYTNLKTLFLLGGMGVALVAGLLCFMFVGAGGDWIVMTALFRGHEAPAPVAVSSPSASGKPIVIARLEDDFKRYGPPLLAQRVHLIYGPPAQMISGYGDVDVYIYVDLESMVKILAIRIPDSDFDACKQIVFEYKKWLAESDHSYRTDRKAGESNPRDSRDAVFSGTIYLYLGFKFPSEKEMELKNFYKEHGVVPGLRTAEYFFPNVPNFHQVSTGLIIGPTSTPKEK